MDNKSEMYRLARMIVIWGLLGVSFVWAADPGVVSVSGDSVARIGKESLFETFASGGWVMWPILFCSLAAIAFGLERLVNLRRSNVFPKAIHQQYEEVIEKIRNGSGKSADVQLLASHGSTEGELLFSKILKRDFSNVRDLEQVLQEYVEIMQWKLQRNIKPLGLIMQICPLLGLFGTVLGMIKAFDVVAEQGLGRPELLASGMAVALLTTGFGLGVAIPCSLFHHYLIERTNRISIWLYNMLHELTMEWYQKNPGSSFK